MHPRTLAAVALSAALLTGGCLGPAAPGTTVPEGSVTPTPASATSPATASPSPTRTATPAPVGSLPSPSACLTDAAPRPAPVDGVEPSTYPEPPADVTRASLVNWTRAFETAYFRNGLLAGDPGDDEHTLAEATASAEVRGVNRTTRGYVIRFSDLGARNYDSGLHEDHWVDVGYVVNETRVVRVPLDDRADPVRPAAGTVVVGCR